DIPAGCEMSRGWCVSVEAGGGTVLTLSDQGYCGLTDLAPWESTVRGCANHLLSFVGAADDPASPLAGSESSASMPAAPKNGLGPRVTVSRSCFDCEACESVSYAIQGDCGHDVSCTHPAFNGQTKR